VGKQVKFTVDFGGDTSAGLSSFIDEITVNIEGGLDIPEFSSAMADFLNEWYDNGATITVEEN